jgi:phosphate starvation-inducible PhoH-like protein
VILDEVQNYTFQEAYTAITRLGKNCRLIVIGDHKQSDLSSSRDLGRLVNIIERMASFSRIDFREYDIVRSGLVKEFLLAIIAEEKKENGESSRRTVVRGAFPEHVRGKANGKIVYGSQTPLLSP